MVFFILKKGNFKRKKQKNTRRDRDQKQGRKTDVLLCTMQYKLSMDSQNNLELNTKLCVISEFILYDYENYPSLGKLVKKTGDKEGRKTQKLEQNKTMKNKKQYLHT